MGRRRRRRLHRTAHQRDVRADRCRLRPDRRPRRSVPGSGRVHRRTRCAVRVARQPPTTCPHPGRHTADYERELAQIYHGVLTPAVTPTAKATSTPRPTSAATAATDPSIPNTAPTRNPASTPAGRNSTSSSPLRLPADRDRTITAVRPGPTADTVTDATDERPRTLRHSDHHRLRSRRR